MVNWGTAFACILILVAVILLIKRLIWEERFRPNQRKKELPINIFKKELPEAKAIKRNSKKREI